MKNRYSFLRNHTKQAFTLAEVLITLVIIGVIAAITVPIAISNYTEHEKYARVKKAYSTLSNAMTRVKADGGDMIFGIEDGNTEIIKQWYNEYLSRYLVATKVCYNEAGCWHTGNTKTLNGNNIYCNNPPIGIGGNIVTVILNDGTLLNIDSYGSGSIGYYFGVDINTSDGLVLFFDINGTKEPNTLGKDIFATVFTENGLVPAYSSRTKAQIDSDCSSTGTGYSCIHKYLKHNNR